MSEVKQDFKIPYEDEINSFLKEQFREDWMDDEDWIKFLKLLETKHGVSMSLLSKEIQIGIDNGYAIETQFSLLRVLLRTQKK